MEPQKPEDPTTNQNPTNAPELQRVSFVSDFLKPKEVKFNLETETGTGTTTQLKEEAPQPQPEPEPNPEQHELLEQLKEDRDELRGISTTNYPRSKKKILAILATLLISVLALSLIATKIINSDQQQTEAEQIPARQGFILPSDLEQKPIEERSALQIINLARNNKPDQIIKDWLGQKDASISKEDFSSLIESYANTADGTSVTLVEKQTGESDLGVAGAKKVKATSLVYRSAYFEHTNHIFLKLNLYEPTESPSSWKLYHFEFQAEQSDAPIKAGI